MRNQDGAREAGAQGAETDRRGPEPLLRSILLVLGAVTMFSCSDATTKYLREFLPAVEISWIRYVTFLVLTLCLAGRSRFRGLRTQRPGLQVARGVALVGSALLFTVGLGSLPIAEATAISFVSPTFITALSIPLLGEKVGPRRWAAVLVGFVGVLIVVQPGTGAFQPGAVFPLLSAASWAFAVVITRQIGGADRPDTTMLWSSSVGLVLLTALLPFGFETPTWGEFGLCLLHGVFASAGQFLMVLAFRGGVASRLAPFSYLQIVTSGTLGFLVFGALPTKLMLLGAGVIIASGLYTAQRERIKKHAAA